jgi:tRNA pseudouridine55 synthase
MKIGKILGCRVGYIGTLDPFATGVLPIAVGEARKFIHYASDVEKVYVFDALFGTATDTFDRCGTITATSDRIPTPDEIVALLPHFLGRRLQIPPPFSAKKIAGRRACDMVRSGQVVQLAPVPIEILSLELLNDFGLEKENNSSNVAPAIIASEKCFRFVLRCSRGTYVRRLVCDIAAELGSVAHVTALRRIKSGFFSINDAISLEKLMKIVDTSLVFESLIPCECPLDDIPALYLSEDFVVRLQNGLRVSLRFVENADTPGGVFRWKSGNPTMPSNVLIFEKISQRFFGIGFVSEENEVRAVRMCSPVMKKNASDVSM